MFVFLEESDDDVQIISLQSLHILNNGLELGHCEDTAENAHCAWLLRMV